MSRQQHARPRARLVRPRAPAGATSAPRVEARPAGDWLERQADAAVRAANAFTRAPSSPDAGERPRFDPVAPAPAPPLAGGGPLPARTRGRLERAYRADLGGVRVHAGPAASAVARTAGARAFAAGRHVVVGEGEAGRGDYDDLLAHEVAHVLQQVGRRAPDGRLVVTDASGAGAIQRVPITIPTTTTIPTIPEIGERHVAADAAADPEFQAYVDAFEAMVADRGEAAAIDQLAAQLAAEPAVALSLLPSILERPATQQAYVVDLLKRAGRYPEAARLFGDGLLRTTFISDAFYQHWATTAPIAPNTISTWLSSPLFEGMQLVEFLLPVLDYLIGATRTLSRVGAGPGHFDAARTAIAAPTEVITASAGGVTEVANERTFATIEAVRRLHGWQLALIIRLAHEITTRRTTLSMLTLEQRRLLALRLRDWNAARARGTETVEEPDEVVGLVTALAPYYADVVDHALVVVDAVLGTSSLADPERVAAQREALRGASGLVELASFHALYRPRFEALFALDAHGHLPTAATFAAAHEALRRDLQRDRREQFEAPARRIIHDIIRALAGRRRYTGPTAIAYLAMARRLVELEQLLGAYDTEADAARARDLAGATDHRVRHRLVIAAWLADVAGTVGWTALAALATTVVAHRQAATPEAQAESRVALFGEWFPSAEMRIGRLLTDFAPSDEVVGIRPITVGDLVTFYQMVQYETLTTRVRAILHNRPAGLEEHALTQALREGAFVGPARHEHHGEVVNDVRSGDERSYGDLLYAHPLTVAYVREDGRADGRPFHITPQRIVAQPFFWLLPPFDRLVARLRALEAPAGVRFLDDIILAHQQAATAAPPPTIQRVRDLEWFEWLQALSDALESGMTLGTEATSAVEGFRTATTRLRHDAYVAMQIAGRDATTDDRVRRVASLVVLIDQYHEILHPSTAVGILRGTSEFSEVTVDLVGADPRVDVAYSIPGIVVGELDRFALRVYPPDEQTAQVAAMVLELAPHLWALLGIDREESVGGVTELRWNIVSGLRPLIQPVIRFIDGLEVEPDGPRRTLFEAVLPGRTEGWLRQQVDRLRAIDGAFDRVMETLRAQFGIRATKVNADETSTDNYFESVGPGARIPNGQRFRYEGTLYKIIELNRSFESHEGGDGGPSSLAIEGRPARRSDRRELFTVEIGSGDARRTHIVRAGDDARLHEVSRALQMAAITESLETLGEALDTFAMLLVDVLEFVPGAGQAVMLARFSMVAMQFVASGELDAVLRLIQDDPIAVVREIAGTLSSVLNPTTGLELLLEYFLLGVNHLSELNRRPPASGATPMRAGRGGRLGRVVRRIMNFGRNMLAAFGGVQSRVRRRVEETQSFLLSHRYVPRVLRFLADSLPQIEGQIERLLGALPQIVDDLEEGADRLAPLGRSMGDVPARLAHFLDDLQTIRLPYNLVDPADILHIAIDLVVRRLGGKYRIAIGLLLSVLDTLQLRAPIEQAIAARVTRFHDPNQDYRNLFGAPNAAGDVSAGPLIDALKHLRNEVVGTLLSALGDIPFLPTEITTAFQSEAAALPARALTITFDREGFEGEADEADDDDEAEGYQAQPPALTVPIARAPSMAGGAPLAPPLRRDAESRFGHDFSHVRMHTGADGAGLTRRFGADAVTSGSHIFVGPNVALGRNVLHHELTHVLQQTGPRPFGHAHDARPVAGAPGRGLRIDPARESAADRVASSLRDRPAAAPVDVGSPEAIGLQPTLSTTWLGNVINILTASSSAAHHEPTSEAAAEAHLSQDVRDQVRNVAGEIRTRFNATATASGETGVRYETPWLDDTPKGLIKRRVLEHMTELDASIESLARDATRPRRPAAATGPAATSTTVAPRDLDVRDFEAALSRQLLDLTGILVHVEFPDSPPAAPAPLAIHRLRVVTIHLPMIPAQTDLVGNVITDVMREITGSTRESVIRHTKGYLEGAGLDASSWTTGGPHHYRLTETVVRAIRELIRLEATPVGEAVTQHLPPASEYADPDDQTPVGSTGQLGLRVGVYLGQRGPERESHHVTQFVLLEFFSNLHGTERAFPHVGSNRAFYGGAAAIHTTGSRSPPQVTGVRHVGMPTDVVGTNVNDRGPGMPTVLLSAPTHRNARLHIHNAPEDFAGSDIAETGSAAILRAWYHNRLRGKLVDRRGVDFLTAEADSSASARTNFLENPPRTHATRSDWQGHIADRIENAMKETYRHLRDFMLPRLRHGLYTAERAYYNAAAEHRHAADSAYVLTPGQVYRIYTAAVARNTAVLETANHWA